MRATAQALALGLFFIAAAGLAQTSGQIRGTAVDDDGKPLPNVKVEAATPSAGSRTTTTDKHGQFRFSLVAPGTYKVSFNLEAYSSVEKNAVVSLDRTVTVNAKLFRLTK